MTSSTLDPTAHVLPRRGRGTGAPEDSGGSGAPAAWSEVHRLLREGPGTCWLTAVRDDGVPHVRPVFAAWTGTSFVVCTHPGAVKTRVLAAATAASVAVDLGTLHLVVETTPARLTAPDDLARASQAFADVYDWPTTVVGRTLDAEYAAPTSGGPPFVVVELTPVRAHAFPTDDGVEPTRWTFD